MIRLRPDHTLEFLQIESILVRMESRDWTAERRTAVRNRIFSALGEQERREPLIGLRGRERWLAIPAGIGVATAIFLALDLASSTGDSKSPQTGEAASPLNLDALASTEELLVVRQTWLRSTRGSMVGMDSGTTITWAGESGSESITVGSGSLSVATADFGFKILGSNWAAFVAPDSVASFMSIESEPFLSVLKGSVKVSAAGNETTVSPENGLFALGGDTPSAGPATSPATTDAPPGDPGQAAPPQDPGNAAPPQDPGNAAPPQDPGNATPPQDPGDAAPPQDPGNANPPADPGNAAPPADPGNAAPPQEPGNAAPPEDPGNTSPPQEPGTANPPEDPGNANPPQDPGNGNPPGDPGGEHRPAAKPK